MLRAYAAALLRLPTLLRERKAIAERRRISKKEWYRLLGRFKLALPAYGLNLTMPRRVPASVVAGRTTFDDGFRVRQVPFHPRPCAPLHDRAQQAFEET